MSNLGVVVVLVDVECWNNPDCSGLLGEKTDAEGLGGLGSQQQTVQDAFMINRTSPDESISPVEPPTAAQTSRNA
jgi:hypothetical protein